MYRLLMVSWVIPSYAGKQWNFLRRKNVSGYCVLNVRRSENMDVYLHERVKEVTEEEVLDNKYQNTILMISNKKNTFEQETGRVC